MTVEPEAAIDQINAVFGKHPGHRALHAKGAFYQGTFTATPAAAKLSKALHLQGDPVPIRVRWSNGGGNPTVPDTATDVRGMAVSFRLPDGTATDLLGQTSPEFPLRSVEEFLALVRAAAKPYKIPFFLARHPHTFGAFVANAKAKAIVPPFSYAEVVYYPVHAYSWTAADGTQSWVRYKLTPQQGERPAGEFKGKDRLREEIAARLTAGPVRFTLEVQVAGAGDDPDDPTTSWGTEFFDAGTLEITGLDPEREQNGEIVVFDPTRVVDGVGLSKDPILLYRAGAYTSSVNRRV
ncbi:catalase family peroxidase [Nocardioides marmorisolisilvae]|uniref:Catalase family peroxidase n=1 Tax=Nocardioides marmorisolisilvae TaxID=1542737 RepID=A0A3N0E0L4_9ACTN|nr:catalase family peroxidase [Nocardioides marmorisolisilvae]RNL81283.1 catalase family peroxidase [Nocardioides marmorisolisilvae]